MIIKIDVDGVIRDIITPMCDLYNKELYKHQDQLHWATKRPNYIRFYDVDKEFLGATAIGIKNLKEWFFEEHSKELFLDANPFSGVKEAIDELRKMGHKIVIVTYQKTYENKMYTLKFLNNFGIKYDDICFTYDKENINGDMLIDDNPEFLKKQDENTIRVLMKRSYNADFNDCHMKIENLQELVNILKCVNNEVLVKSVVK